MSILKLRENCVRRGVWGPRLRNKSVKNVWCLRPHTFCYCAVSAPRPSPDTICCIYRYITATCRAAVTTTRSTCKIEDTSWGTGRADFWAPGGGFCLESMRNLKSGGTLPRICGTLDVGRRYTKDPSIPVNRVYPKPGLAGQFAAGCWSTAKSGPKPGPEAWPGVGCEPCGNRVETNAAHNLTTISPTRF